MNFTRGTEEEFRTSMPGYEAKSAELAKMAADLVRPSGAPPFMLLGYKGEHEIISSWEKKYGVQMFTSGQNHVRTLRTMGINKFVGASYFPEKMNAIFARYFTEAGFQVLGMEGIDSQFADVPNVPPENIFQFMKASPLNAKTPTAFTCSGPPGGPSTLSIRSKRTRDCLSSMRGRHDVARRS